ncbi:hypothetical protein MKX03_030583 [Papaver bracteatum]|nr:hypothetical protein MKX03_030583 [Papaver bracteatum]
MLQPGCKFSPNGSIGSVVYAAILNSDRTWIAIELVSSLGKNGVLPDTMVLTKIITMFCKSGKMNIAWELLHVLMKMNLLTIDQFQWMRLDMDKFFFFLFFETKIVGLNRFLDERVGSALEFFSKMQDKGLKGNDVTYFVLISAFCNVNNIEKAMEIFDDMVRTCRVPDVIVYYSLINGLSRAGRLDDACSIKSKMQDIGFRLDLLGYNVLISGLLKKNKLDKAKELLKEMIDAWIQHEVTYNAIISGSCQLGNFSTAHQVMKSMIEKGFAPTVVTNGALIHGYCKADKFDDALKIFNDMGSNSKVPPNTEIYNMLVGKGLIPNVITYNVVLKGLSERNRLDKALYIMDKMAKMNCNPNYVTMEILTRWLPQVGETERLKDFVKGYTSSV